MACKCYHAERNFIGKIGVCWGTKEREACSCSGDESKCDFYENVRERGRKKGKLNYKEFCQQLRNMSGEFGVTQPREAAYIIEELSRQNERWEEVVKKILDFIPCWVPVTGMMPNSGQDVLVHAVHAGVLFPYITVGYYDGLWRFSIGGEVIGGSVDYWMPLPEPPEEET